MTPGSGSARGTARWAACAGTCHSKVLPTCCSLCELALSLWPCPKIPKWLLPPASHVFWEGVDERTKDKQRKAPEVGCGPAHPPHPPQPLIWARGPCQSSVASADLLNSGWGPTATQNSQTLPRLCWPHTKLVGTLESPLRPLAGRGSQRLCGGLRGMLASPGVAAAGQRRVCPPGPLQEPEAKEHPRAGRPPYPAPTTHSEVRAGWALRDHCVFKVQMLASPWLPALLCSGSGALSEWLSLHDAHSGEL